MSTDRDTTRIVRSWLDDGVTKLPDRVLDAVLDQVPVTPQRRSGWSAWRSYRMNTYARVAAAAAAAAAVLVVAVVGYQFLPRNGGPGGQPTVAPSPSPTLLARGTFVVKGASTTLDAVGAGSDVSGSLRLTSGGVMSVDLECERTIAGLLWIGGDITDATANMPAPAGTRAAIVLKPGAPVQAVFWFQGEDPRAATCLAFLDDAIALGDISGALEPIQGTVQLAP